MGWASYDGHEAMLKRALKTAANGSQKEKEGLLCKFEGYDC